MTSHWEQLAHTSLTSTLRISLDSLHIFLPIVYYESADSSSATGHNALQRISKDIRRRTFRACGILHLNLPHCENPYPGRIVIYSNRHPGVGSRQILAQVKANSAEQGSMDSLWPCEKVIFGLGTKSRIRSGGIEQRMGSAQLCCVELPMPINQCAWWLHCGIAEPMVGRRKRSKTA